MESLKNKITNFFDNKLFLNKTNRKFQLECFEELNKLNFPFNFYSQSRNYQHSISIISDYNEMGNSTALRENSNEYSFEFLSSFFDSKIYRVGIEFSDVDTIYKASWGVRNYQDKNEKWFSVIQQNDLPEAIQNDFSAIETLLQKQLNFDRLPPEERNTESNWLNETTNFKNIEYTPTLEELLLGGLDLYNELGI